MKEAVVVVTKEEELEGLEKILKQYRNIEIKKFNTAKEKWERFVKEIVSLLWNKKEVIIATKHPYIISRIAYEIGASKGISRCQDVILPAPCKLIIRNGKIKVVEIGKDFINNL